MNVDVAAHLTVHNFPGGSESLAPRLGMTGAVLRNKVNANNRQNILSLSEAALLVEVSGDLGILHALASANNCHVTPLAGRAGGSLVGLVLEHQTAEGTFASVLREAIADGEISDNEMRGIIEAIGNSQRVLHGLLQQLESLRKGRANA